MLGLHGSARARSRTASPSPLTAAFSAAVHGQPAAKALAATFTGHPDIGKAAFVSLSSQVNARKLRRRGGGIVEG
jgi:hypothetical protein